MQLASKQLSTSYRTIVSRAWPIIVANSATPLLGLADTAVIGRTGSVASLGAIALGSLIFSFVYWTFGFLRMGTTGFVAQASGAEDELEVRTTLGRSVLMGVIIGLILVLLQVPIFKLALSILSGSEEVEAASSTYLKLRIWGAPAALASYAVMGGLIGLGKSRTLLGVQVVLNSLNIGLDVLLAGYFGMGVKGIALGTMIAEWTAGLLALYLIIRILKQRHTDNTAFWSWSRISEARLLVRTMGVHLNIMIRTLSLLVGFGWFTQQGARLGDVTLAANHILLQFISFSAFFLDGIAYATEALVGAAAGARKKDVFNILVWKTGILAGITALFLSMAFLVFGAGLVRTLTDLEEVRNAAIGTLPFASVYILLAFVTFQLDGIYIGVTRTRDMRNAALASLLIFLAVGWPLTKYYGNTGLWLAFISFILARAATLGVLYPRLRRSILLKQNGI
jgi:MATE family multidrug resistance protein